jgi:hypothetical protein
VSDLHCPATLLLAPYDAIGEPTEEGTRRLVERTASERLSRVYAGTRAEAVQTTRAMSSGGVAAPAEHRPELDLDDVSAELQAIADLHRGETVLVALPGASVERALDDLVGRRVWLRGNPSMQYGAMVEVTTDADGWILRTRVEPTDSVP